MADSSKKPEKVALITGITGQDGSYLAEFLLDKGYEVHGIVRRASLFNTSRLEQIYKDPHDKRAHFFLHYGDITDTTNLMSIIKQTNPDEIYNLAAQSHVKVSFETAEYTTQVDAVGTLRLLEAILSSSTSKKIHFYQASTSELYGEVKDMKAQNELTPFNPRSPYAIAKQYGYWITKNYREAYKLHASNGILFNHESPRRGPTFVTRKITMAVARIAYDIDHDVPHQTLYLGNLDAKRDWGHAKDYVEAMWMMMQQEVPDDYVIATGHTYAVREFVEEAFKLVGVEIAWEGKGVQEIGYRKGSEPKDVFIKVDERYYRPTEVAFLLGDCSKAKKAFGWSPKIEFKALVKEMVEADSETLRTKMEGVAEKKKVEGTSSAGVV